MVINIKNNKEDLAQYCAGYHSISFSPDHKHAVIEVINNYLFVAVNIEQSNGESLDASYVDHYFNLSDELPMLQRMIISWAHRSGHCRLILWCPEMANNYKGSFEHVVKCFHFK